MIRTFLAIDLPGSHQKGLTQVQKQLKQSNADVRWVPVGNIHLTLKFFGNVKESEVQTIGAATAAVARQFPPFDLQVAGAGAFPSIKSPRVIWLGIRGQTEVLSQLYYGLEQAFATLGYLPENRRFNPHLTLGRVRSPRHREKLSQMFETLISPTFPVFRVSNLILFRSTLTPQGAIYTPLQILPLGTETQTQRK
ncbi:MAG: 2'-5' RNA ligase [Desulfobacca sp. 4484_104]|nr:MAG: 2'-5' RNA ligase [Desulfobacca sp. 4484_104]RLA90279.1 MAG: RNA 2',3'-cyclic phosphodiesterase [Deltaproteobacteria bacterium]